MVQEEEELAPASIPGEAATQISLASATSALQGAQSSQAVRMGEGSPEQEPWPLVGTKPNRGKVHGGLPKVLSVRSCPVSSVSI